MNKEELQEKFGQQVSRELAKNIDGITEVILRTGDALKPQEPRTIDICGVIDTPLKWLEKRAGIIDLTQCTVSYNRDEMVITLDVNEHSHYNDVIRGRLIISPEFKKFGINEGKYVTGFELSDLIRMNRSCFENKSKAMELVTIMRNFKAKVTRDIEANDDKKGNRMAYVRQVVEGNQPPSFDLCIPIFKGQPKQKFTVEIDIDPDTLQATLVSPDAQDMIAETRDSLMDKILKEIGDLCPDIPIIEV